MLPTISRGTRTWPVSRFLLIRKYVPSLISFVLSCFIQVIPNYHQLCIIHSSKAVFPYSFGLYCFVSFLSFMLIHSESISLTNFLWCIDSVLLEWYPSFLLTFFPQDARLRLLVIFCGNHEINLFFMTRILLFPLYMT